MLDESEPQNLIERLLNDESLIADLTGDEAKVLRDWSLSELQSGGETADASRIREAMQEINTLVGNRQALVADDLEERMIKLLVSDLDPKSQVRLALEREIAQVTAEKDHISGVELVRRLTAATSKTWRLKQAGASTQASSLSDQPTDDDATAPMPVTTSSAARVRPIPRPTPMPPDKQGVLTRIFGRR